MIKKRVKETAKNLVYYYDMDTIKTLDDLAVWFARILSLNDLMIRCIELIDTSGRNSEGAGSTEIDVATAKNNLANSIREIHADDVIVTALYKDVNIVFGVDRDNGWTFSIVADKNDKDVLDELENIFTTMNHNVK